MQLMEELLSIVGLNQDVVNCEALATMQMPANIVKALVEHFCLD